MEGHVLCQLCPAVTLEVLLLWRGGTEVAIFTTVSTGASFFGVVGPRTALDTTTESPVLATALVQGVTELISAVVIRQDAGVDVVREVVLVGEFGLGHFEETGKGFAALQFQRRFLSVLWKMQH
uniref:Uncharacterized protein n=1 Tax=Chromera velia CCMP2878 TaxID=1169474 RepID=A0A0G4IDS1_9ALVE|eukprot:Cvel_2354.t1-p1 / transcript=Cvel_2354.t1 / gene=Cvel_2354 / organism=Chromera_velia_CCMP2878 / gene_product=hypothetical protein / transcript_product=hypothetical protein / location=Cvel_scaffold91:52636-53004(-) / protein_length=123 / sequence_SO=supercontig / SO=protein_coding / is_pseudo=false